MNVLQHNTFYDEKFTKIAGLPEARIPYVGVDFGKSEKRIMVFGHNNYVKEKERLEFEQTRDSSHRFANAMDEITFNYCKDCNYKELKCRGGICSWTRTWKQFITGVTGISYVNDLRYKDIKNENIISFVRKIAYKNFLHNWSVTKDTNTPPSREDVLKKDQKINMKILEILKITHCICWGNETFNLVKTMNDYEVIFEKDVRKEGFYYSEIKNKHTTKKIKLLKVFHPSRPQSFSGYVTPNESTYQIIDDFLEDRIK